MNPLFVGFRCPCCDKVVKLGIESINDAGNATTNCSECGKLLKIENGQVGDFHQMINQSDPRWPKDGKGTGSIRILDE